MGAEEHPEELPTDLLLSDMTVLIPEAPPMTLVDFLASCGSDQARRGWKELKLRILATYGCNRSVEPSIRALSTSDLGCGSSEFPQDEQVKYRHHAKSALRTWG